MVSLGSIISDLKTVFCGVPQGSILEPDFLSLFIEMTFRNCLKLLDFHLSADYENFLSSMRTSTYLKVKLTLNLEKYIFGYLQTPVSFQ